METNIKTIVELLIIIIWLFPLIGLVAYFYYMWKFKHDEESHKKVLRFGLQTIIVILIFYYGLLYISFKTNDKFINIIGTLSKNCKNLTLSNDRVINIVNKTDKIKNKKKHIKDFLILQKKYNLERNKLLMFEQSTKVNMVNNKTSSKER